jgi:hypothetical protein
MKNRVAWGMAVVLAVLVLGGGAVLGRASGWRVEFLPPSERGFGRGGLVPEGTNLVLDRNKQRWGIMGVYKTPFVRD